MSFWLAINVLASHSRRLRLNRSLMIRYTVPYEIPNFSAISSTVIGLFALINSLTRSILSFDVEINGLPVSNHFRYSHYHSRIKCVISKSPDAMFLLPLNFTQLAINFSILLPLQSQLGLVIWTRFTINNERKVIVI